jgi:hypothetical protein
LPPYLFHPTGVAPPPPSLINLPSPPSPPHPIARPIATLPPGAAVPCSSAPLFGLKSSELKVAEK